MNFMRVSGVSFLYTFLIVLLGSPFYLSAQSGRYKNLVWSDEFNYTGLPDSTKWGYDKARGCPELCGWGNNEWQYYTWSRKENARVEGGHLVIEARKEAFGDSKFTSARLVTRNKGDWKYGRIEVRAQLPDGMGLWPAIWMLPTEKKYGNWPKSGEIDIAETVGYTPDSVYQTIHTGAYNGMLGTQKGSLIPVKNIHNSFHTYSIEWTSESIVFMIDGAAHQVFNSTPENTDKWPFDQVFHLVLNVAVGGDFGGKKGVDDSVFPRQMKVDYVRVYQ
jgi:beta-glucanase (GH16 family)